MVPLGSSEDTVAILYDNENVPFEMLNFGIKKAERFSPCRMIVIADWDECPEQKRWQKLKSKPGFTFRQIERTREGANSLDYALGETAMIMCREGVARFLFITNDADFVDIAKALREINPHVYLMGIGAKQANETLRSAYDKFYCYNTTKIEKKKAEKVSLSSKDEEFLQEEIKITKNIPKPTSDLVLSKGSVSKGKQQSKTGGKKLLQKQKDIKLASVIKEERMVANLEVDGNLQVRIPKSLHQELVERAQEENVDLNQLVTFLLMQGKNKQ